MSAIAIAVTSSSRALPRGAAKTFTYSLTHLVVAIAVTYALTRDWRAALAVGLIEPAVQTVAYAMHERVWARFGGRRAQRAGLAAASSSPDPAHQGPSSP